jgi:hypothetical protein
MASTLPTRKGRAGVVVEQHGCPPRSSSCVSRDLTFGSGSSERREFVEVLRLNRPNLIRGNAREGIVAFSLVWVYGRRRLTGDCFKAKLGYRQVSGCDARSLGSVLMACAHRPFIDHGASSRRLWCVLRLSRSQRDADYPCSTERVRRNVLCRRSLGVCCRSQR